MDYRENDILDYLGGNEMRLAVLLKHGENGRFQLKDAVGNVIRVSLKQILVSHGKAGANSLQSLATTQNAITEAMEEIDPAFLWEMQEGRGGEIDFAEISQSYFGDTAPVHISALARKLPQDNDHFQRIGIRLLVRTPEEAEEVARLRRVRAERAALRERTVAWVNKALNHQGGEPYPVPEEQEPFLKGATDYLLRGSNGDAVNILATARQGLTARETGVRLLKNTHRMPEDADEFLLVNGIHAGFSAEVLEAAEHLSPVFPQDKRKRITDEEIFSIDDDETREIDDALSCRREGENYRVGIYIADPATFVHKDDLLDDVASERPLSLYLPTTTVMMFPDRLSCDLASLNKGQERPSLAFLCTLNAEGELLDWELTPAIVTVSHRLNYDFVEQALSVPAQDSLGTAIHDLGMLADKMQAYREEGGAIVLNRPEVRIRVAKGDIRIKIEEQDTPAHRLVSEFMILANYLAAKYALRNDLPVIYRVQDPPSAEIHSIHQYDPYLFEQQVKHMKRTRLSTYPQSHFGLGLDLYVQISSPLRRYADLVMHRQIAAQCMGEPLPYTQEELFVILDNVERTSSANRSYEREADGYWLFEYLRRNCIGTQISATVTRVEGNLVLAEIDRYGVKGVVMTRERPVLGEHVRVEIREVHPDARRLVMQRIEE